MLNFPIFRAICLKEFIKCRNGMLALFAANLLFMLWLFLHLRTVFSLDHIEIIWFQMVDLAQTPYKSLAFIPILSGIIFCCLQFLPEMRDERLRLSLHLPHESSSIVLTHFLAGLLFLTGLFYLDMALFRMSLAVFYPDVTLKFFQTTAEPWFLAGILGYLGLGLVLLEPQTTQRLFTLVLVFGIIAPLFSSFRPGVYGAILPYYYLLIPLLLLASLLPAHHFRHRSVQ